MQLIFTERLTMYEIEEKDTAQIVKWRSEPAVYRFFLNPHLLSNEEHLSWFKTRYLQDDSRFDWIAVENGTLENVGLYSVKYVASDNFIEVSYLTDLVKQGKGYASEAIAALMKWANEKWNCLNFVAEIHCENLKSIQFIEKIGFVKESQKGQFILYRGTL